MITVGKIGILVLQFAPKVKFVSQLVHANSNHTDVQETNTAAKVGKKSQGLKCLFALDIMPIQRTISI